MHYSTLHHWNGWQWCRTSHIHNCNHANIPYVHTPCCQLASVILPVCPQWKLGCISCTGPAVWQSLFLCTPKQIKLSSSFLFTCNWTSPKSDWAASVTLTKKGRKVSKTWWGERIIGWRKLEQEVSWSTSFTLLMRRFLTAKRHTSPFMSRSGNQTQMDLNSISGLFSLDARFSLQAWRIRIQTLLVLAVPPMDLNLIVVLWYSLGV